MSIDLDWIIWDKLELVVIGQKEHLSLVSTELNVKLSAVVQGKMKKVEKRINVIGEEANVICLAYTRYS